MSFAKKNKPNICKHHYPYDISSFDQEDILEIRKMSERDLFSVMEIEEASFSNPWSLTSFQSELRENKLAHYRCLVFQGEVVGYMGYWAAFDEAHVTNIAITPQHRGKGWGEYLMTAVMTYCIRTGISRMTLEVRVSNEIAQKLYQKLGFAPVGIRPRYYLDNHEDALIMWAEL